MFGIGIADTWVFDAVTDRAWSCVIGKSIWMDWVGGDADVELYDGEVTYRGGWDRVLMMCLSLTPSGGWEGIGRG